jgi:hypothetical protein
MQHGADNALVWSGCGYLYTSIPGEHSGIEPLNLKPPPHLRTPGSTLPPARKHDPQPGLAPNGFQPGSVERQRPRRPPTTSIRGKMSTGLMTVPPVTHSFSTLDSRLSSRILPTAPAQSLPYNPPPLACLRLTQQPLHINNKIVLSIPLASSSQQDDFDCAPKCAPPTSSSASSPSYSHPCQVSYPLPDPTNPRPPALLS